MNSKAIICFVLITWCLFHGAFSQTLEWAKGIGSMGQEFGVAIAVDASGNSYSVGWFSGTVDFDPGVGIQNLVSAGGLDIFVLKLDASGNFQWAKRFGSAITDEGYGVAVDPTGYVYITGNFSQTVDFDPGVGVSNLTSLGNLDIFILKLDFTGNFIWAKSIGGPGYQYGESLTLDGLGAVYVTGKFNSSVDFDPGAGTFTLIGNQDAFVAKLNASGNFVWAKAMGGSLGDIGQSVKVDGNTNVFVAGEFGSSVDFDPGPSTFTLTSHGSKDAFVLKLDSSGNFVWAVSFGGTEFDSGQCLALDSNGDVVVTGFFYFTMDINPGVGVQNVTAAGISDSYVLKLTNAGNFVWGKSYGGVNEDTGMSVAIDGIGNIYALGHFMFVVDFDPGAGVSNLSSAGDRDVYMQKLNSAGNFLSAIRMGGNNLEYGYGIAVLNNNYIYATGPFSTVADFDPGVGTMNLTSAGIEDAFVAKYSQCMPTTSAISDTACNTYTAPDGQVFTSSGIYTVTIPNTSNCDSVITINLTINTSPAQPGQITGPAMICQGTTNSYTIPALPAAATYNWTLPNGWTGASTSDSISASASATGGTISVTAENACGISLAQSLAVTVQAAPAQPGTITGPTTICQGTTNSYTITALPNATTYTWTLPNGWTGTSTSNSIIASASVTSGTITVTAGNACGASTPQTLNISVSPNPIAVFSFTTNLLLTDFMDLTGTATSWAWDFGDLNTSTVQNPSHTYATPGTYNVCLIATANGCSDTTCESVAVVAVRMETGAIMKVSVYPNPSNQVFFVQSGRVLDGQITDMHGKVVCHIGIEVGTNRLDLHDLSAGIYVLRVQDGHEQLSFRLAKIGD